MAQIVLIKNANTEEKLVDDVVSVYEDDHVFSREELEHFTIRQIKGFTVSKILELLPKIEYKHAFKFKVANRWVVEDPECMHVWRELPDGKWKEIPNRRRSTWNVDNITPTQWAILSEGIGTTVSREAIIRSIVRKETKYPENMIEIPDLNIGEIAL